MFFVVTVCGQQMATTTQEKPTRAASGVLKCSQKRGEKSAF